MSPPSATEEPTFTVAELNAGIGTVLSRAFPQELWVRGEIANLSRPPSGHVYFDLVDADCALSVTLWASDRQVVNAVLKRAGGAVRMTDGTEVRVRVRVSWYAKRGQVSLRMLSIDTAYTLGRLAEARELLVQRLRLEGLLARQPALTLAPVPLRVGLVTSDASAAAQDFLTTLEASGHRWDVVLADARVQGIDAQASVLRALERLRDAPVDVVCIVRGGGARTDLAVFDTEPIARAIAVYPIPVLTGIGHEVDTTVADLVAHRRCLTPTACAGALVERVGDWCTRLHDRRRSIARAALRAVDRSVVDRLARQLARDAPRAIDRATRLVNTLEVRTRAVDPARTLARGWSITRDADGHIVRSTGDVRPGVQLVTTVNDGTLRSTVDD
ncbi:MAG TPA: exodeoxyribonuclease VII large subunit [Acidimicrobiales bacterium]|nr:exodeoxyribonuclease VII large subunit [Acidimicrobiales bacterium]